MPAALRAFGHRLQAESGLAGFRPSAAAAPPGDGDSLPWKRRTHPRRTVPSRTSLAHFSLVLPAGRGGAAETGKGSREMFRTIAAAAIVFAFAAFALHHSTVAGPLEEPLLLLFMGTLFLAVGKLFGAAAERKPSTPEPAPQLVERRA